MDRRYGSRQPRTVSTEKKTRLWKLVWSQEERACMHLAPKKALNKQDCAYRKGKKSDIPDENLLSPTNKVSKKFIYNFMVWCNQSNNGIKVNKENYCRYLHKQLFPATEKVV